MVGYPAQDLSSVHLTSLVEISLTMLKSSFSLLFSAAYLLATGLVTAQNSSAGLDFGPISFAGYNNYVYRDNITAAQIVVTE